jgi:EpsI family protein
MSGQPSLFSGPQLVAFAIVALFAWLLWAGESSAKKPTHAVAPVPRELGLWAGKPLEVDGRTIEILETDDVTLMEYRLGEEPPLWFAQVAGFGNRAAFHPPELCYVGSHLEVLEREPISVIVNGRPRRLMRLVVGQGSERLESWYWFTANSRLTPNYYQQQIWLVLDSIRRKPRSGTLVRISTPIDDPASSHRRLLAFVTSWDASYNEQHTHGS